MVNLAYLAEQSKASQESFEIYQILRNVAEIKPKVIVEIGCDGGGFLDTLEKAFPQATVLGIDLVYKKELDKHSVIKGDSTDEKTLDKLKKQLAGKEIDFLWLDGDHHYHTVKREFEMYAPLVRPGGIIGFHDINSRGITGVEVSAFCRELDQSFSYPTVDIRLSRSSPGSRLIWLNEKS